MKKITIGVVLVASVSFVYISFWGIGFTKIDSKYIKSKYKVIEDDMVNGKQLVSGISKGILTEGEEDGLLQMREEEKLARDVYITLGKKWSLPLFSNISQSEQTHTDAIKILLDRYIISDPVSDNTVGVFRSQTFQKLYDDFVAKGSKSLVDALIVGATVEDLDIFDLENLMNQTDKQDILVTYSNLQRGSRNHMRAFVKNINSRGGTYAPQYIPKNEFNIIVSSLQERGV